MDTEMAPATEGVAGPTLALGTLRHLDPSVVWGSEARDFTPWLRDNLKLLSVPLGLPLELPAVEVPVGDFRCDVLARVAGTDHPVVIENQLGATDHTHLGQVILYAAGLGARAVVWIAKPFREEHRQALDWLNANTHQDLRFFGVELEILQIDASPLAVNFKLVSHPNDWQRQMKAKATETPASARARSHLAFGEELLARYNTAYPGERIANKMRADYTYYPLGGAGRTGYTFNARFMASGELRVQLTIEPGDPATCKRMFERLAADRAASDAAFGEPLVWDRMDHARMASIYVAREGRHTDPEPDRTALLEWAVEAAHRLRATFRPRVRALTPDRAEVTTAIPASESHNLA